MIPFIFLMYFFTVDAVQAQSFADIQNIKVDNLSDSQIEQLIKRAESAGMTEDQLEAYALEKGMPVTEVAKLRARIMQIRSGGKSQEMGAKTTRQGSNQIREIQGFEMDPKLFDSLRKSDPYFDLTPKQKKIFGFKLFHNRELNFNPSLSIPTPQTYVIGAGDQLLLDVYGVSQQSFDLTVNPEGKILIPNIGPVQVGGATIEAATSRIKSSLSKIYSGLSGSNPNTFLEIRLGNIRTISVSLVGELSRPGTYTLPSFASVFNALFAAGGPNENGTFRYIQLYRNSKLFAEVDIYDFLTRGEHSANVTVRDNDVIIVQPFRNRVEISGPVRREGFFEMKDGESLEDLLRFAGGFSSNAYKDRITVRRTTSTQMNVEDVAAEEFKNFKPKDGDELKVGELINRFENRVQLSGAVFRPGEYSIPEGGIGIKELIQKGEGLTGDAYTKRAVIYRTKENLTLESMSIDLEGILNGSIPDVKLKREDVLSISSMYDLREEFYVQITGEVNIPGAYAFAEKMTVADLVVKAGGFREAASNSYIEIARRVRNDVTGKIAEIITLDIDADLKLKPQESDFALQPFDHIFIRKSPGFQRQKLVTVEGEVFYPGEFSLSNATERISDLIKRAGGLNQFAYAKGATLVRRTEYFKEKNDSEIKEENLKSVAEKLEKDDILLNEAEKILLERINSKLEAKEELKREEEMKKKKLEDEDPDLRLNRLLDMSDSAKVKIEFKEQELVGINLEQILKNPGSSQDLILMEGDIIRVPKELQTVRMRGQVLFPTTARFEAGRGFKGYISRSGGFTEEARRSKSYVVYANGDVRRTRNLLFVKFYPNLEPGAEIIVPQKPERVPLGPQQWVAIGTGLATLGLIIVQIIDLSGSGN
ncbi:polysaccharide biosynthesis protein [Algoriphagus lacus]|uniref:Polysaccharide biosynthesis protein n=2 Tax=Algoriphagus lacus TaxID=2056311 RepID=A0A418PMP6_9BACT|nr:polysaccharide biosynthesis protein [Algoriphagus lacus]